ncbi:MAG: fimbria/pilus outer membrane usher protein [Holosporaceae bacterium]|jgi:outer membrane usher protein|nr:fimbria/pilus outer membrane usher protein [Holosporaceae bacterium]
MKKACFVFFLLKSVAVAGPIPITSGGENIVEREEEILEKIFGKRNRRKDVLMEFTLLLDGEKIGEAAVMIGKTNKVFVKSMADLLSDYLAEEETEKIRLAADRDGFVSFETLNSLGVNAKFNMTDLQLEMSVAAEKKKARSLGKRHRNDCNVNTDPADFSGFVNMRISNTTCEGRNYSAFIFSPTINFRGVVLEGECSRQDDCFGSGGGFRRDYTSLVWDYPEQNITLRCGDVFSCSADYHSVPGVWGIEFKKKPRSGNAVEFVAGPQITLLRKSNIEVYVNDSPVKTKIGAAPGIYTLDDISCVYGANDVKIKITDDTGRERYLTSDVFLDDSFLGKGEVSFGLTAGYPENCDRRNGRYDKKNPIISGFAKYGLSNALECMAGAQRSRTGNSFTTGVRCRNRYGSAEMKYARSRYGKDQKKLKGGIFYVSYVSPSFDFGRLRTGFGVSFEKADTFFYPHLGGETVYADNFPDALLSRRENIEGKNRNVRCHLFFNELFGLNLSLNGCLRSRPGRENEKSFSANVSKYVPVGGETVGRVCVACCFESRRRSGMKAERSFGINCSVSLKDSTVVSASCSDLEKGERRLSVCNNSPNRGFGYNLSLNGSDHSKSCLAETSYRHARFRADLSCQLNRSSPDRTRVGFETGLFFADGGFGVSGSRPYDGGFVIVRPKNVPAGANIKFLNSRAESGVLGGAVLSSSKGVANSFRVDLSELPDGTEITPDVIVSYGRYKRGSLAEISAEGNIMAKGILRDMRGDLLSQVGGFALCITDPAAPPIRFFTNSEGKFVMNGLKPGKYKVSLNAECCDDFIIEAKESENRILDLGTVVCRDCNESD